MSFMRDVSASFHETMRRGSLICTESGPLPIEALHLTGRVWLCTVPTDTKIRLDTDTPYIMIQSLCWERFGSAPQRSRGDSHGRVR
jgi:hypothetical protein